MMTDSIFIQYNTSNIAMIIKLTFTGRGDVILSVDLDCVVGGRGRWEGSCGDVEFGTSPSGQLCSVKDTDCVAVENVTMNRVLIS